jgi:hypothetical protein
MAYYHYFRMHAFGKSKLVKEVDGIDEERSYVVVVRYSRILEESLS